MRKRYTLGLVSAAILLVTGIQSMLPVRADAAPPQFPPGASIGSGGFITKVQMVSEYVRLDIAEAQEAVSNWASVSSDVMAGHVDAIFVMQNQGEETESFEVWFPLGASDGYSDIRTVENFAAWVNGVPAEIGQVDLPGQWDTLSPWATWPATFPPGERVILTVSYDVRPTGYMPYGAFEYILETGADWWGAIGTGIIRVRLPYAVNEFNVPDDAIWQSVEAGALEVDETDLIWRFTDLEPTTTDNIELNVLAPQLWQTIADAEQAVAANPDSAAAYLELARAQVNGLEFKYELVCCIALAEAARASFQQALALAPTDITIHLEYVEYLALFWFPYGGAPLPDELASALAAALAVAPDNERLLEIQAWINEFVTPPSG